MKTIHIVTVMLMVTIVTLVYFLGVTMTGLFTIQSTESKSQGQTYIISEESATEAIQNISEGLGDVKSSLENLEENLP